MIKQGRGRVIILAEASEGVNGSLPWQPKLEQHLRDIRDHGHLRSVQLQVERYSTSDSDIKSLTQAAEALALESTPII